MAAATVFKVYYTRAGKDFVAEAFGTYEEVRRQYSKMSDIILHGIKPKWLLWRKPSKRDVYLLLEHIGTNLRQEQNSTTCLKLIVDEMDNGQRFKNILHTIVMDVHETGCELSTAFAKFPEYFGSQVIALLRSVEIAGAGDYSMAFLRAAELLKRSYEKQQKFIKDISYPLTLFIMGNLLVLFLSQLIVPLLFQSDLFKQASHFKSGLTYKFLVFMVEVVPPIFAGMIMLLIVTFIIFKTNRKLVETIIKRIPFIREVLFNKEFELSFYLVNVFLKSEIRLEVAMELVAKSTKMVTVRTEFNNALSLLRQGYEKKFVDGFTSLESLERSILKNSEGENMEFFIKNIHERFNEKYELAVNRLPKVTAFIILGYCLVTIILGAMALFMPLNEVFTSLSKGL